MSTKKQSPFAIFYITLVIILMYLPILVVVVYSFNDTKLFHWAGFTLDWYTKLMNNTTIIDALWNSIKLAVMSSFSACVLGTACAVTTSRRHFKTKAMLENLSTIPIMVPEIILGMAYLAFFTLVKIPFGMFTMVLAHSTFCVPYIYINVKASLAGMDPALGEAALDLGASPMRVFTDITAPLIAPAIVSGTLLAFAMSMDDVVISFFTTGPETSTLPLQVYSMLKMGVTPEINALCTVMLGTVFIIVALVRLIQSRQKTK